MPDEPLLTVRQVAERLQISPVTVQRWLRSGRLKGLILSDRMGWRVPESEVQRIIDAGMTAGGKED